MKSIALNSENVVTLVTSKVHFVINRPMLGNFRAEAIASRKIDYPLPVKTERLLQNHV